MNASTDRPGQECFPDVVVEDYALGRLRKVVRDDFERHVQECADCAARLELIRAETTAFQGALHAASGDASGACCERETLAMYLDRALDEQERERLELHLSTCRRCQRELVALHREVGETLRGEGPTKVLEEAEKPRVEAGAAKPKFSARRIRQFPQRRSWIRAAPLVLGAVFLAFTLVGGAVLHEIYLLPVAFLAFAGAAFLAGEIQVARARTARAAALHVGPHRRKLHALMVALSGVLFVASLVWERGALWLLTGSAACWSAWLVARVLHQCVPLIHHEIPSAAPGEGGRVEPAQEEERGYSSTRS